MGDVIAMADVTPKKSADMQGYDETFWAAVAEEVRTFVAREVASAVASLRSEFELRVKMLEGRGTLEYLGVHEAGAQYVKGQFVTAFGSLWHCNATTRESPGTGTPAWTLAAKRGRDAKDASGERRIAHSVRGPGKDGGR
jgi:hypothetical protein